jgi:peptide/nickel transport system permease protein
VFDLGYSFVHEQPVLTVLLDRLGVTLLLMATSLTFAFSFGVILGTLAARRAYTATDTAISVLGLIFYATPSFFLGLMMIVVFSVKLAWLPPGGIETVWAFHTGWARVLDIARHLIMPTTALSLIYLALYMRLMRASVLEVVDLDHVRTARAKGVGEGAVMVHHVMRNALLPVVTLLGLQFSTLLGGSVVVETVFTLPGLGQAAYQSVAQRDYNLLLGIIFLCSLVVVAVNLLTDILYARLDARIEL